jgi:uncharacterized protein
MKKPTPGALALAFALLATASPAVAQSAPAPRPAAHVDVTGQGTIERNPDRVLVSFSIVTNDDNATRATSANNALSAALTTQLHGLGIEPPAIKTTGYSVTFNQRPPVPNPQFPQRYGYVVTRGVVVTSDRTDQAGAIVDAGVAAGVTNVGGISFGLRDSRTAYREALAAAVADAEGQARALAAAGHVRIVRLLALSAVSYAPSPRAFQVIGAVTAARAPIPTDVQPSDLSVTATVSVSYEVAP